MKTTVISQSPPCVEVIETKEEWYLRSVHTNVDLTTIDGGWTEHDDELLKDWPILSTTIVLNDIDNIVNYSHTIRRLIVIKNWGIECTDKFR